MQLQYLGNDPTSARKVAEQFFHEAASFHTISNGQENLVIVADDSFVMRFPRTEEIWQRGVTERRVLKRLSERGDLPVPKLITISEDPAYIVATYLEGQQLSAHQLRSLSSSKLEAIGRAVATFAFHFHKNLSLEEFQPLIQPPSWSYDAYLRRELFEKTDPNLKVDALAKDYYQKWLDRASGGQRQVIHDDLHTGNLLFDADFRLSGVLDFGAVCVGTTEQDLRQAYRLGEAGFEAAASTYESLSGQPFNRELAKLWTITQELATYCRDDTDAVHERARENLAFWFPEVFENLQSSL